MGAGRPFKPGQSGNPGGRPPADPEIQALKALTAEQFKEVANLVLAGKRQEASDLVNDQNAPLLKRWLAKMADQGFTRGDQQALEFFLNRLIGKVKEHVEVTGTTTVEHALKPETKARLDLLGPPKPLATPKDE